MPTPDYINWPTHGPYFNNEHPLARGCKLAMFFNPNWGMGQKAVDLSPHGNDGTLTNMEPASDWTARGLDFDVTNDVVVLPSILLGASTYTAMISFRLRSLYDYNSLFENNDWAGFVLHTAADGTVYAGTVVGDRIVTGAGYLSVGLWTHLAISLRQSGHALYKNGILTHSDANPSTPTYGASIISADDQPLDGQCVSVLWYDHDLTDDQLLLMGANKRGNKRTFGDRKQ